MILYRMIHLVRRLRKEWHVEKDFTKNEHLYKNVIAAIQCNRIRYAINTLEAILINDPTDILAINTLSQLYPMIGDSRGMVDFLKSNISYVVFSRF